MAIGNVENVSSDAISLTIIFITKFQLLTTMSKRPVTIHTLDSSADNLQPKERFCFNVLRLVIISVFRNIINTCIFDLRRHSIL